MNILFILPEYYPHSGGGISTYYINYIKALQPYCNKIKVVVGSGYINNNDTFNIDGIDIEYLKPAIYQHYLQKFTRLDLEPELKQNLAAAWAMHQQANFGNGFDIIECTDFGFGFIPWVIEHNKPVITRLHGSAGQIATYETGKENNFPADFIKQTELLLLPACDVLITHSTANKTFWNNLFNADKTVYIPPVFDASVDYPLPLNERNDYGLITARIQQWKGPIQLCEAVAKIPENERPILKWVGRDMQFTEKISTGQYLDKDFASVWNKNIIPQNPLKNDQIKELQRKAKFGIVPSTWDMFNFTALEFLAAGTPLICSDGAGASDLIEHGKNGLIYPAFDTNALANCIKLLNNMDDATYYNMALAGIKTVNDLLAGDTIISQNLAHYKTAIKDFIPAKTNKYLQSIYLPDDKVYTLDGMLDKQPFKPLFKYLLKRLKTKWQH